MSNTLAILCYHRLVEEDDIETTWPYMERGTAVRMASFRSQLKDIVRFADVVPERVALGVLAGRQTLSRPAVWLTFDDGYRDVLKALGPDTTGTAFVTSCAAERSLPADDWYDVLLAANRTCGTVDLGLGSFAYDLRHREGRARLVNGPERRSYLRSSTLSRAATLQSLAEQLDAEVRGSRHYLSHTEMLQLLTAGWTLGSHGVTHTPFDAIEPELVAREARESLEWLLAMGVQARSLALPDGSMPKDPMSVQASGYECVLGLGNRPAEQGAAVQPRFIVPDDPHWVRRVLQPTLEAETL
ncbi:MAG: hypothetical protein U0637_15855 [Phycisphaerales bacterium]